jgi:hypothetical protein
MQLRHIHIANLTASAANMRGKGKVDIGNIFPSVRARGIDSDSHLEVTAIQRRRDLA